MKKKQQAIRARVSDFRGLLPWLLGYCEASRHGDDGVSWCRASLILTRRRRAPNAVRYRRPRSLESGLVEGWLYFWAWYTALLGRF
jgi:hypothetical protein